MASLKSIEQKQIEFQDGQITAVLVQDKNGRENVYVPLKPLVEGMGLDWSGQSQRIKRNPILNESVLSVVIMPTEKGRGKGARKMLCLSISKLNGFLFGIEPNMVSEKIRPLILKYQRECYKVLFNAFNGTESMKRFYSAIGHDGGWIEKRIEKHTSSTNLGDAWLLAGVPIEQHDQLQDVINNGTFGLTIAEHKQLKGVEKADSLADNMTRIELLVSAIADEAAVFLSNESNATGYTQSEEIAKQAGEVGKGTIEVFESKTGGKVLSDENHLDKKRLSLSEDDST